MTTSTDATPLVSIILPTYNRAGVIGRAIQSVLDQTYPHWELIIVDDASTDQTAQIVQALHHPCVYYVRLPINCGHPSRPRNIGWLLARGVYIAYIDDDNAWRPNHLERLVTTTEAQPEAAGAYGGRRTHWPDGHYEDMVAADRNIDTGDGLHRRDLLELMPEMWTETNFTNEDLEFWGRLRHRHSVGLVRVDEVLSDYYSHDGNRFNMHWLNFRRYDRGYYRRLSDWLDDPTRWQSYADLTCQLGGRRMLDVGCGRGWTVRALRERGVAAWGVDPSPVSSQISIAQRYHLRGAADRLPFADAAFDTVLCMDVLAHIPEPFVERSLRELVRVTRQHLVLAIDCSNPSREGHTTLRPREWWVAQCREVGAELDPREAKRSLSDGLELLVMRPIQTLLDQGDKVWISITEPQRNLASLS